MPAAEDVWRAGVGLENSSCFFSLGEAAPFSGEGVLLLLLQTPRLLLLLLPAGVTSALDNLGGSLQDIITRPIASQHIATTYDH